ncbi:hypothetical protein DL89DRAFT_62753 [Linderina pennispora]|uniref:Secreted protein n=1 Tax=Linderina pennispora TaxID=61395 RepID=A0A1Y1VRH9_9FUNG|nr:uncharacterized protein DL89DRAFT_62753 [Linderina pennispora]ORX63902.1 hypothetical protein DL89DRAFT_62753 [Linderina pennispora]
MPTDLSFCSVATFGPLALVRFAWAAAVSPGRHQLAELGTDGRNTAFRGQKSGYRCARPLARLPLLVLLLSPDSLPPLLKFALRPPGAPFEVCRENTNSTIIDASKGFGEIKKGVNFPSAHTRAARK